MSKKKRRGPGRPKLTARNKLSELELEYAVLRGQGKSIEEASELLGVRESEMRNRESIFEPLQREIDRLRGVATEQKFHDSVDLVHKILKRLRDSVLSKTDGGTEEITINEITRASELIDKLAYQLKEAKHSLSVEKDVCSICERDKDAEIKPRKLLLNIAKDGIDDLSPYWRDRTLCGLKRNEVPPKHKQRWEQLQVNDPEVVIMGDEIERSRAENRKLKAELHESKKLEAPVPLEEGVVSIQ